MEMFGKIRRMYFRDIDGKGIESGQQNSGDNVTVSKRDAQGCT